MFGIVPILALACVLVASIAFLRRFGDATSQHAAPRVAGLPVLGSTLNLARDGAQFLHRCRKRYGDIFRVSLGGQQMTYLTGPDAMKLFFSAPDDQIAFRPATEHFTQRVFGLPSDLFFPHHTALLQGLRGQLTPDQLPVHGHTLLASMQPQAQRVMSTLGKADLLQCIKDILFPAAVESIFGAAFLQHHSVARLQQAFFKFEEGFELAASPLPHFLQPSFCQAKRALLEAFRISWTEGHFEDTVVGQLLHSVPDLHPIAPHVLLALLWASLANTVPAAFWALAFLLLPEHQHYKQQVLASCQQYHSQSSDATTTIASDVPQRTAIDRQSVQSDHASAVPAEHGITDRPPAQSSTGSAQHGITVRPSAMPAQGSTGQGASHVASAQSSDLSASLSGQDRLWQTGLAQQSSPASPSAQARPDTGNDVLVVMACDRSSLLAGCVAEAVRLRAPGVAVRRAACNLPLPRPPDSPIQVNQGDMLAVSPYESHHDSRFFSPDPCQYNPRRAGLNCPASGLHQVPGVGGIAGLVFGGGRYRCPGRFFAEMEVALTVILMLTQFDMYLRSSTDNGNQRIQSTSGSWSWTHLLPFASSKTFSTQSGDAAGLLPLPETRRQVGIRWPQTVCEVTYMARTHCA